MLAAVSAKWVRTGWTRMQCIRQLAVKSKGPKRPKGQGQGKPKKGVKTKLKSWRDECPPSDSTELPKMPVPELNETLKRFLSSSKPVLNCAEYCQSDEIVKKFGEAGGEGEYLQLFLKERAKCEENWLEDFWLHYAYLDVRTPVCIFSSPAEVLPKQKICEPDDVIMISSNVAMAALKFKTMIDKGYIKQEMMGKERLDMGQYKKLFGGHRIPFSPSDRLTLCPDSKHILVVFKESFYKVNVVEAGQLIAKPRLYAAIETIVKAPICPAVPIGVLTSNNRDEWSLAYETLRTDFQNRNSLKVIEDALFALCIDDKCCQSSDNQMTNSANLVIHGGGPNLSGANRWYDKTLQFIIGRDGTVGINFEQTPTEGSTIAKLTDHIVNYLQRDPEPICSGSVPDCEEPPEKLVFNVTDCVEKMIVKAQTNLANIVNDLDVCAFSFDHFGKKNIQNLKLSPDSFIQMAIQLAFYKLHNEPCAQYETGHLRRFHRGRTETIRSCSMESVRFVQAMTKTCISCEAKANALRLAIKAHKEYANAAINGMACDRHLLGLRKIAEANSCPVPEIFSCPAYLRSTYFRMSTSQMATESNCFMNYAPLVSEGYACCYTPRAENINFGTSAFLAYPGTCALAFKGALESSLIEMRDVIERTPVD